MKTVYFSLVVLCISGSAFAVDLTTCYLNLQPADATPSFVSQFPMQSQLINKNSRLMFSTTIGADGVELRNEFMNLAKEVSEFTFLGCKTESLN